MKNAGIEALTTAGSSGLSAVEGLLPSADVGRR
jgi:hypothetical protein